MKGSVYLWFIAALLQLKNIINEREYHLIIIPTLISNDIRVTKVILYYLFVGGKYVNITLAK